MTITVPTSSYSLTFCEAVDQLLLFIGEEAAGTLVNPSRRTMQAMTSVREARNEVWYEARWPWRRGYLRVNLVDGQMWYELPEDFGGFNTGLSKLADEDPLPYITYERLIEKYPNIRAFPPGETVVDLSTVGQLAGQVSDGVNYGEPICYTDMSGYIGLMPIPDAPFVADEPALYCTFWRNAPPLTADEDDLAVPAEILGTVMTIAQGRLKIAVEFADGPMDQAKGANDLRKRKSADAVKTEDGDIYFRPSINHNE